jgi:acetoacetate decarboxylase
VSAHGQPLAEARVTLHDKVDRLAGLFDRPIVTRRYFPRLCAGMHDKPVVDELVLCIMDDILITDGWIGSAELIFPEAHGEELDMMGPIKVGRGYRVAFSFSVSSNEILADLAG